MKPLALALACVAALTMAAAAHAQSPERKAEAFVRQVADQALATLYDRSLSPPARAEKLKAMLVQHTDFRRVAGFMLGRYARALSRDEREAYLAVLPEYASQVYFARIGELERGVNLSLGKATRKDKAGRQIIVPTNLYLPNDPDNPIAVQWWVVFDKSGAPKLFDVGVAGVWFAQEQRAAFASLIQRNGGRPGVVIDELRRRIKEAQARR